MRRPRGFRGDSGVSSVELAVIAPSLLLLTLFVIQVCLWFYGRSVALESAREGVSQLRLAQTEQEYDDAVTGGALDSVKTYATKIGSGALNDPVVAGDYDDKKASVTVTVQGTTISLVPGLHFAISQKAHGRIERFQAAPLQPIP